MQVNRVAFNQCWLETLNTHAVKRGSTVEKNRVILNHLLENIPHLFVLALQHLLCAFYRVGMAELFQTTNDKRLEQL